MKEEHPNLPCPRCACPDTLPVRRFGYPLAGKKPGTSRWQCTSCDRHFDGPEVDEPVVHR